MDTHVMFDTDTAGRILCKGCGSTIQAPDETPGAKWVCPCGASSYTRGATPGDDSITTKLAPLEYTRSPPLTGPIIDAPPTLTKVRNCTGRVKPAKCGTIAPSNGYVWICPECALA